VDGELEAATGGATHALRAGDTLAFPSGERYLLRNAGRAPCTVHMAILHAKERRPYRGGRGMGAPWAKASPSWASSEPAPRR
jgi:glyoxylate utilization-related uncharacterized protein